MKKQSGTAIQIRSSDSKSGIVTTGSGGKVRKITIDWNTATSTSRTIDIYGKSSAYTAASELYKSDGTQGTNVGSLSYSQKANSLTIDGDYEYIGIRSKSGAVYIEKISIEWETGASPTTNILTVNPAAGTYPKAQTVEISASADGSTIYYTTDGTEPDESSNKYSAPFSVTKSGTVVKALAVAEGFDNVTSEATYTITPDQPVFSEESKTFTEPLNIKLSLPGTTDETSAIHYAIGATATDQSPLYDGTPIEIKGVNDGDKIVLHAVVVDEYGNVGKEKYCTYTYSNVETTSATYKKVTSSDEIVAGGVYLIICESKNMAMSDAVTNYRNTVDVAISDGVYSGEVNATDKPYEVVFEESATTGYYKIKDNATGQYLCSGTSDGTNLKTMAMPQESDEYLWKIDIAAEYSPIYSKRLSGRFFAYNHNGGTNSRIALYKSATSETSRTPVSIYKKVEDTPDTPDVPTSATLNIVAQNEDGYYATFSSDKDVVFADDVVVYTVVADAASRKLTFGEITTDIYEVTDKTEEIVEGYYVPKNTGVIVYSVEPLTTYYFPVEENPAAVVGANMMRAVTEDGVFTAEEGYLYYKLAYDNYSDRTALGFYWGAADGGAFSVKKGLAYLAVPQTSQAAPMRFVFGDGETTGISSVGTVRTVAKPVIYNIAGQRVERTSAHGVYIVNGKKVVLK